VKFIIAHALRHAKSGVKGRIARTAADVLAMAMDRHVKTVPWLNPEEPVLGQLLDRKPFSVCFDQPANTAQILNSWRLFARTSGIGARITSRSARNGAAADIAQIPASKVDGLPSFATAESLGHEPSTLASGTTGKYIGFSPTSWINLKGDLDASATAHIAPRVMPTSASRTVLLAEREKQLENEKNLDQKLMYKVL
jgi:hypothetical protein